MIEIPGYRLLRQLGRGGMATVYLAVQESVDREVALKVMSPALLADANFGERFLREAKIAAKLHHRHVVGIHDVGRAGDYHYIAMEYLAGGPVLNKDGRPRPVGFALRVIREIAGALNYAQEKGFVHRDVKPDNIVLRDDGSAVLTDFGIARASDSTTRMTRTGAVVGTPHYMSPEQARGRQIDGRSDIYGLGIVLYEMLVGCVPYHADDSLAIGIMHISEPVPRLPQALAALQPLIDRLLAKEPEQRFQNGNEAAAAIAAIERRMAEGELAQLDRAHENVRPEALAGDTHVSPAPPAAMSDGGGRQRAEPRLGRLDEVVAAADDRVMRAERHERPPPRARRRRRGGRVAVLVILLLLGAGVGAAWKYQDRLRALLPRTELNDILARAQKAQTTGNLTGTKGDSASELYRTVLAVEPDNDLARNGLTRVGQQLLALARAALSHNDLPGARRDLDAARDILGGGVGVDQLDASLKQAEARGTQTGVLLGQAQAALAAGSILGDGGAVVLYRRALSAEGGNAIATAGLNKCADALAAQARDAFAANDLATASARIDGIAQFLPGYPDLTNLRGRLASAREAAAAALADLLKRAEAALRAGRISGGDDTALVLFQTALKSDPGNARATSGLRHVAQALVVQANAAIELSNPPAAEKLLVQAQSLAPTLPELRAAKGALADLRGRLTSAARRPPVTAADTQHIQTLVAEAAQAANAGNLILPPGASAYDKYRAALAIDGDNADAQAGLNRLPARAKELFDQSLKDGTPYRARSMLDAIRQIAPDDPSIPPLSARLAEAFLDQAAARIGEGRAADAERALAAARELAPDNPRLAPLEQKLRALPPGSG